MLGAAMARTKANRRTPVNAQDSRSRLAFFEFENVIEGAGYELASSDCPFYRS
jgi:hypothetical protein